MGSQLNIAPVKKQTNIFVGTKFQGGSVGERIKLPKKIVKLHINMFVESLWPLSVWLSGKNPKLWNSWTHHQSAWKVLKEQESCQGRRPRRSSLPGSQCSAHRCSPFSSLPAAKIGLISPKKESNVDMILFRLVFIQVIFWERWTNNILEGENEKYFRRGRMGDAMMVASSMARLLLTILFSPTLIEFWIAIRRRL